MSYRRFYWCERRSAVALAEDVAELLGDDWQRQMNEKEEAELLALYRELREYVEWRDDTIPLIQSIYPIINPHIPALIDDFYREIERHPQAMQVITGGEQQIRRLKRTLEQWLRVLFVGDYSHSFVIRRWSVGRRHVEIGLDQHYATAALSRLRHRIISIVTTEWRGSLEQLRTAIHAVNRLIDLDIAVIQLAYQQAYIQRVEAEAESRIRQSERLAAIGQVVTGLAHESRNVLQRSHACLETLLLDVEDRPEAKKLAERIQGALDQLQVLYEEVRNFAAPIILDLDEVDLMQAIRTAWSNIESLQTDSKVEFKLNFPAGTECKVLADHHRLNQVLHNLLTNAAEAVLNEENPRIICHIRPSDDLRSWLVTIEDNGPGFLPEEANRAFEPFFTTKSKGTGLGLAICRRIVDAHQGAISLDRHRAMGASFEVKLPRVIG